MSKKRVIVVDTSVIVKWLNRENEQNLTQSDRLFQDGSNEKIDIIAPELVKYEVGNVLLSKGISLPEAKLSLATIYTIPMKFVQLDQEDAQTTMEIAHTSKITYYDASFLTATKKFAGTLVTDNIKDQKSVDEIKVIALKDY